MSPDYQSKTTVLHRSIPTSRLELFPVVHYILCLRRTPRDNKIYILVIRINHESDRTVILRINNLSTEIYPELKGHIPVRKS